MNNKNQSIQTETWEVITEFLSHNHREDCVDALAVLTEKQALGIASYINVKVKVMSVPESVILATVLYDLQGFNSGNDMFIPKTGSFQPKN
jgi:hypothetical protein